VGYFSQSKDVHDRKRLNQIEGKAQPGEESVSGQQSPETVSILGPGISFMGNIVCTGPLQIFGRVKGDIHASNLVIGKDAQVEGNIIAQEVVINGAFKGTVHGNSVKLQGGAVVDGEILNRSLIVEQGAQFEGVSRRLETPIDPPARAEAERERLPSVDTTSDADGG
jgi:cytoskeletal protein CcmA (bactofilin family)